MMYFNPDVIPTGFILYVATLVLMSFFGLPGWFIIIFALSCGFIYAEL